MEYLNKYRAMSITVEEFDGKPAWQVDLAVRRPWPLCWLDHRPWEKFERRCWPARTFMGFGGLAWFEMKNDVLCGAGGLGDVLNGICAIGALRLLEAGQAALSPAPAGDGSGVA